MGKNARKYKPPAVGDPVYMVTTTCNGGSEALNVKYYGSVIRKGGYLLCQCEGDRNFRIPSVRMGGQRTHDSYWALAYSIEDATALLGEMLAIMHRRLRAPASAAVEKYAG